MIEASETTTNSQVFTSSTDIYKNSKNIDMNSKEFFIEQTETTPLVPHINVDKKQLKRRHRYQMFQEALKAAPITALAMGAGSTNGLLGFDVPKDWLTNKVAQKILGGIFGGISGTCNFSLLDNACIKSIDDLIRAKGRKRWFLLMGLIAGCLAAVPTGIDVYVATAQSFGQKAGLALAVNSYVTNAPVSGNALVQAAERLKNIKESQDMSLTKEFIDQFLTKLHEFSDDDLWLMMKQILGNKIDPCNREGFLDVLAALDCQLRDPTERENLRSRLEEAFKPFLGKINFAQPRTGERAATVIGALTSVAAPIVLYVSASRFLEEQFGSGVLAWGVPLPALIALQALFGIACADAGKHLWRKFSWDHLLQAVKSPSWWAMAIFAAFSGASIQGVAQLAFPQYPWLINVLGGIAWANATILNNNALHTLKDNSVAAIQQIKRSELAVTKEVFVANKETLIAQSSHFIPVMVRSGLFKRPNAAVRDRSSLEGLQLSTSLAIQYQ